AALITIPPHVDASLSPALFEGPIRPSFHFGQAGEHSSIIEYPERSASAWLAETTLSAGGLTATARFERAHKAELFGLTDPRHDRLYDVRKLEAGLIGDVRLGGHVRAGLGGTVSRHFLPRALRSAYRDGRWSYMVFARFALAA